MDNKIVRKSACALRPPEKTGADGVILPIRWGVFHRLQAMGPA
jgi:hypothetical protein